MQEQISIENVPLKIPTTVKALVEALIFAAHEPLSMNQIRSVYQGEGSKVDESRMIEPEMIRQIVSDLNREYEKNDRPYRIVQVAGGYQFATLSTYAEWLGKLYKEHGRRKLSQSGVETLSIIAYKQPITKGEIEKIRGVNCDYVLKALLEKELIIVTGRAESVGRPLLYGTTKEFLKHFGLNDVTDLPRPREIEEILGESQFETERRMIEAQAGAEQMQKEQEDFKSRLPHIPKKKPELDEKEVEIIQQKKTREIKIVQAEDRRILKEAGQEKIDFALNESTQDENFTTSKMTQNDLPLVTTNDTGQEEANLELVAEQNDRTISSDSVLSEQSGEEQQVNKGVILSTKEMTHPRNEPPTMASENIPKPKRWQVWKEKIQSFIKKLFV
jgi:segregation and condensation protein B